MLRIHLSNDHVSWAMTSARSSSPVEMVRDVKLSADCIPRRLGHCKFVWAVGEVDSINWIRIHLLRQSASFHEFFGTSPVQDELKAPERLRLSDMRFILAG